MREAEETRRELNEDEPLPLEKNDFLAMCLAGFISIGLPCIIMIGIVVAAVLLLFG